MGGSAEVLEKAQASHEKGVNIAAAVTLLETTAPEQFVQRLQVGLNGPKAADEHLVLAQGLRQLREHGGDARARGHRLRGLSGQRVPIRPAGAGPR